MQQDSLFWKKGDFLIGMMLLYSSRFRARHGKCNLGVAGMQARAQLQVASALAVVFWATIVQGRHLSGEFWHSIFELDRSCVRCASFSCATCNEDQQQLRQLAIQLLRQLAIQLWAITC